MSLDIRRITGLQVAWLANQERAAVNSILRVYQDAWLEMEAALQNTRRDSYTGQHIRAIQSQLTAILEETRSQHGDLLGEKVEQVFSRQIPREREHWAQLEAAFGDAGIADQFRDITPVIPQRSIHALVTTQNIAIKNFTDDLTRKVRHQVGIGLTRGEGIEKTMRRLQRLTGESERRVRLIARMETARASNEGKETFIRQVAEQYPELDLWQLIQDRLDKTSKTRNYWFSWAISGTVRNVTRDEWFEVTAGRMSQARAEYAQITRRKTYDSGILWESRDGGGRKGKSIPAHWMDRAVLLAWRPSWPQEQFGEILHPQGPIKLSEGLKGGYETERLQKLKEPHSRHYLNTMDRSRDKNTLVLGASRQQVSEEIAAIKQGNASRLAKSPPRFIVESGRVYGWHDNTFYPAYGPGFETLTPNEYAALKSIQKSLKGNKSPEAKRQAFNGAVRGLGNRLQKHRNGDNDGIPEECYKRVMGIVKAHLNVKIQVKG